MNVRTETERVGVLLRKDKKFSSKRILLELTLLTFAGFVVHILVAAILLGGLSRAYEGDESDYVYLATHIVQGSGFTDNSGHPTSGHTPGLPLLLTIPIWLVGPNITAIRIFMCLIESLLIPTCYLLARSLTGSARLGLLAAVIAIFFPSWIIPSGAVLTDIPAAILVTLMAWMLIEGHRRQSVLWVVGAGFVWGAGLYRV